MTASLLSAWPLSLPQGLRVDGRDLADLSAIVQSLAPFSTVPARRGDDTVVPVRRGQLRNPAKMFDAVDYALQILVRGLQPDGTIPTGSSERAELYNRLDELTALLCPGRTVRLDVIRSDGTARTCDVEVTAAVTVARDFGLIPAVATVAVTLRNADAFWRDIDDSVSLLTAADDTPQPLYEFSGSTAPLDDLTYIVGPSWNPIISDAGGSGTWLAYDAVITDGQALIYDGATQQVSGGGGLIVDQGKVRRGRQLTLAPASPPSLSVSSSSTAPVTVQVAGRRAYLTA